MDNNQNPKEFHLYSDIRERTGGEIYIGVVGPVRTGKSTFIKRCLLYTSWRLAGRKGRKALNILSSPGRIASSNGVMTVKPPASF